MKEKQQVAGLKAIHAQSLARSGDLWPMTYPLNVICLMTRGTLLSIVELPKTIPAAVQYAKDHPERATGRALFVIGGIVVTKKVGGMVAGEAGAAESEATVLRGGARAQQVERQAEMRGALGEAAPMQQMRPEPPSPPPSAPAAPITALPTIQQGAIGLGLDNSLSSLSRMGAKTYEKWFEEGLTRVRPEEANLSSYKFQRAFTDAAEKAPQIVFDLSGLDVAKALADGPRGFVGGNYTSAELNLIVTNEKWLGKTLFLNNGKVVRPVFVNGKLIGFAP